MNRLVIMPAVTHREISANSGHEISTSRGQDNGAVNCRRVMNFLEDNSQLFRGGIYTTFAGLAKVGIIMRRGKDRFIWAFDAGGVEFLYRREEIGNKPARNGPVGQRNPRGIRMLQQAWSGGCTEEQERVFGKSRFSCSIFDRF